MKKQPAPPITSDDVERLARLAREPLVLEQLDFVVLLEIRAKLLLQMGLSQHGNQTISENLLYPCFSINICSWAFLIL